MMHRRQLKRPIAKVIESSGMAKPEKYAGVGSYRLTVSQSDRDAWQAEGEFQGSIALRFTITKTTYGFQIEKPGNRQSVYRFRLAKE